MSVNFHLLCGFLQVPSTWRPLIEDPNTLQLFLDYYSSTKPTLSSTALECLVSFVCSMQSLLDKVLYMHHVLFKDIATMTKRLSTSLTT